MCTSTDWALTCYASTRWLKRNSIQLVFVASSLAHALWVIQQKLTVWKSIVPIWSLSRHVEGISYLLYCSIPKAITVSEQWLKRCVPFNIYQSALGMCLSIESLCSSHHTEQKSVESCYYLTFAVEVLRSLTRKVLMRIAWAEDLIGQLSYSPCIIGLFSYR